MTDEKKPAFRDNVILDVTNFETMSPDEPVGYLCGCTVSAFPDGRIMFHENGETLECFRIHDLNWIKTNINSYDPNHLTEISLITASRSFGISFEDAEKKHRFIEYLKTWM